MGFCVLLLLLVLLPSHVVLVVVVVTLLVLENGTEVGGTNAKLVDTSTDNKRSVEQSCQGVERGQVMMIEWNMYLKTRTRAAAQSALLVVLMIKPNQKRYVRQPKDSRNERSWMDGTSREEGERVFNPKPFVVSGVGPGFPTGTQAAERRCVE